MRPYISSLRCLRSFAVNANNTAQMGRGYLLMKSGPGKMPRRKPTNDPRAVSNHSVLWLDSAADNF
jgi:hypothetical protein